MQCAARCPCAPPPREAVPFRGSDTRASRGERSAAVRLHCPVRRLCRLITSYSGQQSPGHGDRCRPLPPRINLGPRVLRTTKALTEAVSRRDHDGALLFLCEIHRLRTFKPPAGRAQQPCRCPTLPCARQREARPTISIKRFCDIHSKRVVQRRIREPVCNPRVPHEACHCTAAFRGRP